MIFLLSPDTEFLSTGISKRLTLNYKELFFTYKKVLVLKWNTKHIIQIISNINHYIFKSAQSSNLESAGQENHTDTIDHALAALDMESLADKSDASKPATNFVVEVGLTLGPIVNNIAAISLSESKSTTNRGLEEVLAPRPVNPDIMQESVS